jgi:hypothetical protein
MGYKMEEITIRSKIVKPHKSFSNADFDAEKVLTNSVWDYVEFHLRHSSGTNADSVKKVAYYWDQARIFVTESAGMKRECAPLTLYYGFLNAAKALLEVTNHAPDNHHGMTRVKSENSDSTSPEDLVMKVNSPTGAIPSLFNYYKMKVSRGDQYSLKNFYSHLPFIHRTYCHTYQPGDPSFFSLSSISFGRHDNGYLFARCTLAEDVTVKTLPSNKSDRICIQKTEDGFLLTSKILQLSNSEVAKNEFNVLSNFNSELKQYITHINGTYTLWYFRSDLSNYIEVVPAAIGAMHLLSDLSRYNPLLMKKHLESEFGWLTSEFIEHAADQFIDAIASEITGKVILRPNLREPK